MSRIEPEILEFKQNLTTFAEILDKKRLTNEVIDTIRTFAILADHYLTISDEEMTPDSKFIKQLLNKYHVENLENNFKENFGDFIENLKFLVDKAKNILSKPLLSWYEKFKDIKDFVKQIESLTEFIELL